MEILVMQFAIIVLICLWWIKPFKTVVLLKKFRMPAFNLILGGSMLFISGYALLDGMKGKVMGFLVYDLLFLFLNLVLFVLVPLGFLYLRRSFSGGAFHKSDLVHAVPGLVFTLGFIGPYFLARPSVLSISSGNPWFVLTIYGYCVIGAYILLVMKSILNKYLSSDTTKKKKPEKASGHESGESSQVLSEIVVGSIHLDTETMLRMDEKLRTFLLAGQPFLKRGYNLKQLSADTSIPLHHLSAFINQAYQVHFNDFINEYRVRFCQVKIRNDEWQAKTLEAIAEESGFNNRNTFTAAFRKVTGQNPSEFLKQIKLKQIA
jgi:AraC-like DNA-binding protein